MAGMDHSTMKPGDMEQQDGWHGSGRSGGSPYKQAFDRGVKLIGATSHFVTADLDEGPIIEQDIVPKF